MKFLLLSLAFLYLVALCEMAIGKEDFDGYGNWKTKETIENFLSRFEELETRLERQEEENFLLSRKLKSEQQKVLVFKNKEDPTAATVVSGDVESQIAAIYPRSCQEIYDQNPTISTSTNGDQYIDPDGPGVGEPPIFVECADGTTKIKPEGTTDVPLNGVNGGFSDAGSYSRDITYTGGATIRQMSALAALSTSCRQKFIYKCKQAYFQLNGVQYSWWLDRYGSKQFFWAGNFKPGTTDVERHTCQCGIPGIPGNAKCRDSQFVCNCDVFPTATGLQLTDEGYITEKSLLPITQLNLGKIVGSSIYTIGDLECSGSQGTQIGEPNSCRDLYQLGHTLNGFYTVRGLGVNSNNIETVFCNFRVPAIDGSFETRLGILCNECQKSRVYFYAQRFNGLSGFASTISFEKEVLNVGGALDLARGIFTAPVNGIYYFSYSGYKCPNSFTYIYLYLNEITAVGLAAFGFDASPDSQKYSIESTLRLQKGDTISLLLNGCILEGVDIDCRVSHFNGWLLEEE